MASQNPRPRNEDIRIAIICALNLEYDAVKLAFDMTWEGTRYDTQDGYCYCVGQIGGHTSLLVSCEPGKVNAATVTGSIQVTYTGIKLAVVAGICGGVPRIGTDQELRLGDVVISKSIFQYDYGRKNPDKFRPKEDIEDVLPMPGRQIRSFLSNLQQRDANLALQLETNRILQVVQRQEVEKYDIPKYGRPDEEDDYLYEADYVHRHRDSRQCDCKESGACEEARDASCDELGCEDSHRVPRPRKRQKLQDGNSSSLDVSPQVRVRFGRFGSGDTVMKSGRDRDTIASQHGLMAFEMEGAGVRSHNHDSIIVKAVCDYADSHKNKSWQNFSAAVAASATKAVLESFSCEPKIPCTSQLVEFGGNPQLTTQTGVESRTDSFIAGHSKGEYDEIESKLLPLLAAEHERYKNFNPPRVRGTCEWFLKDRKFREWLESSSGIIWVSAGPGCGKSVLARSLIDENMLSTNPEKATVCHFFFKDGQERRTSSSDALSAILHQLFDPKRANGLIRHAQNPFKSHEEKLRDNFYQLWEILVNCAKDPNAGEIVCILDALDECNERCGKEILRVLKTFYFGDKTRASSRLKFIITSRPYDHLESEFLKFSDGGLYVRLDGDDKSADIGVEINLVIDYRVNEIAERFSIEQRQKLLKHLKDMDHRTYLWLHLTMGIIDERRSAYGKLSRIEKLLKDLPSDVTEAYEKILSRSPNALDARCLLQIVLAAKYPLTLEEVNHCFALQEERFSRGSSYSYDDLETELWTSETVKSTIRNLSGLFLSVCNDKVSFIHKTARDFLIAEFGSQTSDWQGKFHLPSAHNLMFISCFRFLSLQDFNVLLKAKKAPPFMVYAAKNWVDHYNSQDEKDRDKVHQDAQQRGYEIKVTQDAVIALAMNREADRDTIGLLLEKGGEEVEITQEVLLAAAAEGSDSIMDFLLERYDNKVQVTQEVILARATKCLGNAYGMASILEKGGEGVRINQEVLLTAARKGSMTTVDFLLEEHGDKVKVTRDVIKAAGKNWILGERIISLISERYGHMEEIKAWLSEEWDSDEDSDEENSDEEKYNDREHDEDGNEERDGNAETTEDR
ncbi:nacht and ankyrin domain protein [Colletotrichum karsti]|uniref:Nacht and ankyrin domain protein n=1 Tax=Colletotrichum karsti TaxID=1095194 RepID=A0A9P6I8N4_9PEZI|nr:nacht and ankyrin domain protein [Colletotrichum karsti]KAF9878907.1 nacht and ankyrin domain protein [Colletotrichum karsti]